MGLERRHAIAAIFAAFVIALGIFVVFRPGDQASAGVELGDPHAWIEHGIDGELLQINALTGEVTARVEVSAPGDDITAVAHADGAVVLNANTNSIAFVSGRLLSVTSTVPLSPIDLAGGIDRGDVEDDGDESEAMSVFGSPEASGNVVIVSEEALVSIDPQTSLATPVPLSAPLRSVTQDMAGRVTALTADGQDVLQLESGAVSEFLSLVDPVGGTGDQRSLVRAGSDLFVVDPSRLSVAEIGDDGTLGVPFCTTSAAIGALTGGSGPHDEPVVLAYNPRTSLLNVSSATGGCENIDIGAEGELFGRPVAANGMAYLPNWTSGRIIVVDLDTQAVVANFPFGSSGVPFELEVFGSNVWANERLGPFAAVVTSDSIVPVPKISTIVAGVSVDSDEEGEGSTLTGGPVEGSGLRVLGDSGDEVIAAGTQDDAPQSRSGVGTGTEGGDAFDGENPVDINAPTAIGIEASSLIEEPTTSDEEEEVEEVAAEVLETLVANFSVSTGSAVVGERLRFTDTSSGSPTSWTWDFGDGTGAQEPDVQKSWDAEGTYLVSLTVTSARGDESTQLLEIVVVPETVLLPPAADFTFDRSTIEEGESVTFTSRTSGEVDRLEWNFGDGQSAVGGSAQHMYESAGTYTVTLTATNNAGSTSTSTEITVVSGVVTPVAAIAQLPGSVVQGQIVTLRHASENGPTRLSWDLGDGTTKSGPSVDHAWEEPGTYRVRLTAENSAGSDSTFADITVTKRIDPPVSQFTQSATEVFVGEEVSFTNLSLNDPTILVWNFGDDTTKRGETVTKSWSKPGRYRVTLRATNDAGTNRTGVTIVVSNRVERPQAAFSASATVVAPGSPVTFSDESSNDPTSLQWDFGDGSADSGKSVQKAWSEPGTYTVKLNASNDAGASTAERQIVVKSAPSANFRWETVEGTTIKFTDTSWDDPQNWRWDFGDGSTSTDRSPTHTFPSGTFNVTLVVSNEVGSSPAKTQSVTAVEAPISRPVCRAEERQLVCSASQSERAALYTWRSADALTNSSPNAETTVFTFARAGEYDITLDVSSSVGVFDSATITAPRVRPVVAPPVAEIQCEADGAVLRCSAESSKRAVTYAWSADGAVSNATPNQVSTVFAFERAGRFDVTLRVENEIGTANSTTIRAPRVSGGDRPDVGTVSVIATEPNGLVRLRAEFSSDLPVTWEWQVDGAELVDGGNSPEPLFRVTQNGTFNGELKATNQFGTDTDGFSFEANPFATTQASFTWRVANNGDIRFTNTSETTGNASVEWRFNGDTEWVNDNNNRPRIRYPEEGGTFEVVLIVEDDNGRSVVREDIEVPER